jgi:hypothetical protein
MGGLEMIVMKQPRGPSDSEYVRANITNGILSVNYLTVIPDAEKKGPPYEDSDFSSQASASLTLPDYFAPNTLWSLYFTWDGGLYWGETYPLMNSRDGADVLKHFYKVDTSKYPVVELFFLDSSDDYILVSFYPLSTNVADPVLRSERESLLATIEALHPPASALFDKFRARRDLNAKLDPNDSIAALESQVDVLSQLVFTMMDAMPDCCAAAMAAFPQYEQFKAAIQAVSVLTIKPAAVAIPELQQKKQQVRQLQQAYYAAKGGAGN